MLNVENAKTDCVVCYYRSTCRATPAEFSEIGNGTGTRFVNVSANSESVAVATQSLPTIILWISFWAARMSPPRMRRKMPK